jgi:predicted Zn finger-like uncharacterized protein
VLLELANATTMKFICGECKTKYTISDEKVRGKVLKVKCKKCEAIVEVREAAAGVETIAPVVAARDSHDSLGDADRVTSPTPAPRTRVPSAPPGGAPRPRVPTSPPGDESRRPRVGTSAPGDAPRARVPSTGPGDGPRARVPTGPPVRPRAAPPPPPADAMSHRTTTPHPAATVPRAGKSTPVPGPPPRAAAPGAPATSSTTGNPAAVGIRPAARPASFVGRGGTGVVPSNGGRPTTSAGSPLPGGLVGSLAEALRESMVPEEDPELAGRTKVTSRGILEDLGISSRFAQPEWYVAVRDEPLGPLSKDDVQAKIQQGDVTGNSLVWREGMDDWRPLRDVHALGDILRGTGRAPVPAAPPGRTPLQSSLTPLPIAPDRALGSVATPIAGTKGAVAVPSATLFPQTPPPSSSGSGSLEIPIEDIHAPVASPGLPPPPGSLRESPGSVDQYASVLPPAPAKRLSPMAWVGMIGAVAFGVTLALGLLNYLGPRLNSPHSPTERVRVVTVPGELPPPDLPANSGAQVPGAALQAPGGPGDRRGAGLHGGSPANSKVGSTKNLSAADAELLARMAEQGLPPDRVISSDALHHGGAGAGQGGSSLTADQIRSVVRHESRSVQQCYERAMRGSQQAQDMRVTVTANVGPSGTVTSVRARGGNDANMLACIEGAVRHWHFPTATGASMPEIPFVFTAADR